jgi:hypothetical protein
MRNDAEHDGSVVGGEAAVCVLGEVGDKRADAVDTQLDLDAVGGDVDPPDQKPDDARLLRREKFVPGRLESDQYPSHLGLGQFRQLLPRLSPCPDDDFRRPQRESDPINDHGLDLRGRDPSRRHVGPCKLQDRLAHVNVAIAAAAAPLQWIPDVAGELAAKLAAAAEARNSLNVFTNEPIQFAAKPASKSVRGRPAELSDVRSKWSDYPLWALVDVLLALLWLGRHSRTLEESDSFRRL